MKPNITVQDSVVLGMAEGEEIVIDANQMEWIINGLRNGIYKYKIKSPAREYIVNARDEHRKHKPSRPIEITLPTRSNMQFKVRDFAGGLLPEVFDENGKLVGGVKYYFGRYGVSDKRESNDAAGYIGIGAKSAFAYNDMYTIISFKDNTKYTFTSYIDSGNKGRLLLQDTSATDEPNGIEITIPVKYNDQYEFEEAVEELTRYMYDNPPVFHDADIVHEERKVLLSGTGWRLIEGVSEPVAIMGEIAYPIDRNGLSGTTEEYAAEHWMYKLLSTGLELDFAIGDIDITFSREALQMNDLTQGVIKQRLFQIKKELQSSVEESFNSCKTLFEAKSLYYDLLMQGSAASIVKDVVDEVVWNGITIKDNHIDLGEAATIINYTKDKKRIKRLDRISKLKCAGNIKLYLDDTDGQEIMYRRRANTIFIQDVGVKTVTIVQVSDENKLRELGIDVANMVSLKAIPPTALVSNKRVTGGVDVSKRVKHTRKVFKLNRKKLEYLPSSGSDYWEIAEVDDNTAGVFLPISRFIPISKYVSTRSKTSSTFAAFSRLLDTLEEAGIEVPDIYGDKTGSNTFDTWFETEVKALSTEEVSFSKEWANGSSFPALGFSTGSLDSSHIINRYREMREKATKLNKDRITAKETLFSRVGATPKPSEIITPLRDELYETYPMLKIILTKVSHYSISGSSDVAQDLLDYINDVDILNCKQQRKVA